MDELYHDFQQLSLFSDNEYIDISQHSLFDSFEAIALLPRSRACLTCGKNKPLEDYDKQKSGKAGYRAHCKVCRAKERKEAPPRQEWVKVSSKICPQCDPPIEKPIDEFGLSKDRKDGHNPYCKECARRIANSDKSKTRRKKYEEGLGEEFIKKRYAGGKAWRGKNIEKLRVQWREKYANDPEYAARMRANTDKWAQENPDKRNASQMKRKAITKGAQSEYVDYQAILEQYGPWCYICEGPILAHHKLEFDHIVPLVPRPNEPQGAHTAENIRPTHKECNARKSNKQLQDMLPFDRRGPDN
jgi:5-methylcytosine-specific restriction endonuclease McrA